MRSRGTEGRKMGSSCDVWIINGNIPGRLEAAMKGEDAIGTLIRQDNPNGLSISMHSRAHLTCPDVTGQPLSGKDTPDGVSNLSGGDLTSDDLTRKTD